MDLDPNLSEKIARSIRWNADILGQLLKQIAVSREMKEMATPRNIFAHSQDKKRVIEEVSEAIPFAPALPKVISIRSLGGCLPVDPAAFDQLHDLITAIALLYRSNPFHNFEVRTHLSHSRFHKIGRSMCSILHYFQHASHVTMSVVKLMSRINDEGKVAMKLRTDPLVQFAMIFSSLIHDLDHPGVPNQILVKEQPKLAKHYHHKSVAEQQSFDIAWGLLMEDRYDELRRAIFQNDEERERFRQIVVNAVMATDLLDTNLQLSRQERWAQAYLADELTNDAINRKATVVLENIMQASDVAHMLQHWHIYRQWNELLFEEAYHAYRSGRSPADPSAHWYDSEITFFDTTAIPIAQRLKDSGVFGPNNSDEFLNYVLNNKKEWVAKGQTLVAEMTEKCQ